MQSQPVDHRDLIKAYDLGHVASHSPGLIHWHPNGVGVVRRVEDAVRGWMATRHYQEVRSPAMLARSLWEQSGHWEKYAAGMFRVEASDGAPYAMKPMSCPGHIGIYAARRRSYRELPLRLFEFGHVHRDEPSGALSGWLRLRGFEQDDAHVFASPGHIEQVVGDVVAMIEHAYPLFGFSEWYWRLSLRPEVRAGDDALWDRAEEALRQACRIRGIVVEEVPGEGAFYGPKLEAVLRDRLGRSWQCGVAQVDMVLPFRFGLSYQDASGQSACPVIIHHAILGSLERWLAIVMEHRGALPDWLAPCQVAILPVSDSFSPIAHAASEALSRAGVRNGVYSGQPLGGRIRAVRAAGIPLRVVIGEREASSGDLSISCRGQDWHEPLSQALVRWPSLLAAFRDIARPED